MMFAPTADRSADRTSGRERAGDPDALEPLAQQARAERMQVELDVGKLGHDPSANINTR